eukprot:COSAG04_NODE_660_length_11451_cov_7.123238_6_plen_177_part_00
MCRYNGHRSTSRCRGSLYTAGSLRRPTCRQRRTCRRPTPSGDIPPGSSPYTSSQTSASCTAESEPAGRVAVALLAVLEPRAAYLFALAIGGHHRLVDREHPAAHRRAACASTPPQLSIGRVSSDGRGLGASYRRLRRPRWPGRRGRRSPHNRPRSGSRMDPARNDVKSNRQAIGKS